MTKNLPIKPTPPTKPDPLASVPLEWDDGETDDDEGPLDEMRYSIAHIVKDVVNGIKGLDVSLDTWGGTGFDLCLGIQGATIEDVVEYHDKLKARLLSDIPIKEGTLDLKFGYNMYPIIKCEILKTLEYVAWENQQYEEDLEYYEERLVKYEHELELYNLPPEDRKKLTTQQKITALKKKLKELEQEL